MEAFAIKVEKVSKVFRLPHEKTSSIKSAFVNFYRRKKRYELQSALKDVSFEIKKGEFFGIVGRNGSGKSTLLKLLAGIYTPTSGQVHVRGTLTPFIELGVGFNPELTGRENVFLNGALVGFNRKEMNAMYEDIVSFAELEKFMDQKLKNYSSGMQVRLAFSIAIRAQSDILLIDEVLAVGDAAFQQKCYDYFKQIKDSSKTVILVSHDMDAIKRFCSRCLFLEDGQVQQIGSPNEVADTYIRANNQRMIREIKQQKKYARGFEISILDKQGKPGSSFEYQDELTVKLAWDSAKVAGVKNAGVAIFKGAEYVFGSNTVGQGLDLDRECSINISLNVNAGKYRVVAGLFGDDDKQAIDFESNGPEFIVNPVKNPKTHWDGLTMLEHKWSDG